MCRTALGRCSSECVYGGRRRCRGAPARTSGTAHHALAGVKEHAHRFPRGLGAAERPHMWTVACEFPTAGGARAWRVRRASPRHSGMRPPSEGLCGRARAHVPTGAREVVTRSLRAEGHAARRDAFLRKPFIEVDLVAARAEPPWEAGYDEVTIPRNDVERSRRRSGGDLRCRAQQLRSAHSDRDPGAGDRYRGEVRYGPSRPSESANPESLYDEPTLEWSRWSNP